MGKHIHLTRFIGAAVLLLFFASNASATIIKTWDWAIDSAWTDFTDEDAADAPSHPVTGSEDNTFFSAPTVLSWGEPLNDDDKQSSLKIVGNVDGEPGRSEGSVNTNGGEVNTGVVIHENFVIDLDTGELETAMLSTALTLDPTDPDFPALLPGAPLGVLEFDVMFEETLNSEVPCPAGDGNPCNDIFIVDVIGAGFTALGDGKFGFQFSLFFNEFGLTIPADPTGMEHLVTVSLDSLTALDDGTCAAGGAGPGCIGFITNEGQENQFETSLAITVPEPGVIALMSLGLLGLGFRIRK